MATSRALLASRNYFSSVIFTNQKCNTTPTPCQSQSINSSRYLLKKTLCDINLIRGLHTRSKDAVKYDWQNAALIVVGACKGIGAHVLKMALNEGVESVTNLDINEKAGFAMQYELNQKYSDKNKVRFLKCDITDEHQHIDTLQNLLVDRRKTYVIVNNAGLIEQRPDMSKEAIDSNVVAIVTSSVTALELMRKDEKGSGGAIINLAPVSILCHLPYFQCYNATKSSILTFNMSLGDEEFFSKTGVRVLSVCYGATDEGLVPIVNAKDKEEIEKLMKTKEGLLTKEKAAAKAVIEIYKTGRTGSTWLSKEIKPAEDITEFIRNIYSDTTEIQCYYRVSIGVIMYDLKDKVAVVTGASNGIGASFVREILEEGIKHVRLLDIDKKTGNALQDELRQKYGKDKVKFVKCDVTDDGQFFKALEDAKKDNGYLDLLVNNAGVAEQDSFARIRKLIEINITALINGTLKAIEMMRTDKGGRGGAIINVCSVGSLIPVSPMFLYSTSKRAAMHFTTCVGRVPCENTDVRVMAACIGVTDTAMLEKLTCYTKDLYEKAQKVLASHPMQSSTAVARCMVEMYQKGGPASIWLIRGGLPAQDVTAQLDKADEEMEAIIRKID
uniref:15-hydroxyprostaglandin dehydrogenase [NAD(+)] n=1 Tax=Spodoptera frugiperda TaxID=7108 RepID=A0A2H1WQ20_SPOFR